MRRLGLPVLALLLSSTLVGQKDSRAEARHFWAKTGYAPSVTCSGDPVLGSVPKINVAGGAIHALFLGTRGVYGVPFTIGSGKLLWYLDLSTVFAVFGGLTPRSYGIPLPNDSSLLGVDIMTQAFGTSFGGKQPGASSLLILNLGRASATGHARYDVKFTASVKPRDDLRTAWGLLQSLVSTHDNRSCYVTFYGSKTPGVGPIQLRTSTRGGGSRIISVPSTASNFSVTGWLAARSRLYLWNADRTKAVQVTWSIGIEMR